MDAVLYVSLFVLGTIIGSFNNVLVIRGAAGRAITGRSACMQCKKTLQWYELIPIISFLILRGKCHACKSVISSQYPVVELLTGIAFLLSVYMYGFTVTGAFLVLLSEMLLLIGVYDAQMMEIPDTWNYVWVMLAIIFGVVTHGVAFVTLGLVIPALFFLLWHFSKGRALGFGDVIFAIGMGASLGLLPGLVAVWIASTLGALYGGWLLMKARLKKHAHITLKTQVPFGPFLALGTFCVLMMQPIIFSAIDSLLMTV